MSTTSQTTRLRSAPVVLGLVFALAACTGDRIVSGTPPTGKTRPFETAKGDPGTRVGNPGMAGVPEASQTRTGVVGTHVYHVPACALLEGVPGSERVPFVHNFDALDADYFPCPDCKPGP